MGDEDDVGAAGHARVQRDPADLVAHDLDHEDAAVRVGGRVNLVDAARGHLDGARKAEGHVRAPGVVVDGLGQGDDVEALLGEAVGGLGGAVAAEHEEAVELELGVGVLHGLDLVDSVGLGRVEELEGGAARAEDGAAHREQAGEVAVVHQAEALVDEALVAVFEAVDLDGLARVAVDGLDDAAHGGVERLAVAAAREESDSQHGCPFLVESQIDKVCASPGRRGTLLRKRYRCRRLRLPAGRGGPLRSGRLPAAPSGPTVANG